METVGEDFPQVKVGVMGGRDIHIHIHILQDDNGGALSV